MPRAPFFIAGRRPSDRASTI